MADSVMTQIDQTLSELSVLDLGSSRGGRRPAAPLEIAVVRSLTAEDVPLLQAPPPVEAGTPGLLKIRSPHHLLAQTLAQGVSQEVASMITGYSPSRISILKTDPTFAQLLDYYVVNKELAFADVLERAKNLGLASLEELQSRLDEEPEKWSKRELMDLADLTLGKTLKTPQGVPGGPAGGTAPAIAITFVQSPHATKPGLTIDGSLQDDN
jgi:hypothetical protein